MRRPPSLGFAAFHALLIVATTTLAAGGPDAPRPHVTAPLLREKS
jgi:hypothetical protein